MHLVVVLSPPLLGFVCVEQGLLVEGKLCFLQFMFLLKSFPFLPLEDSCFELYCLWILFSEFQDRVLK